ncbi:MAG: DUF5667 domain-containing protein [Candidatus Shapirobacteria bacterium]|nr:DUF5667 domain-containing protein [Candidatus Shapirobacteria bacterium]
MGFPIKRNILNSVVLPTLILFFAFMILFISLSRAGLEIAAKQQGQYGVVPVDFIDSIYKLPPVDTLPTSPFYGLKRLRDYLWLTFSNGPVKKSQIALLLSDKKIAEAIALFNNDQLEIGLNAGIEAVDKLKYADKLIANYQKEDIFKEQMEIRIFQTGNAYKEIMTSINNIFGLDEAKYQQIITDLNKLNEEKQKEKNGD